MRLKGADDCLPRGLKSPHACLAGQARNSVNRYCAGSAHANTAGAPESQAAILPALDTEKRVENRHAVFERDVELPRTRGNTSTRRSCDPQAVGLFIRMNGHVSP